MATPASVFAPVGPCRTQLSSTLGQCGTLALCDVRGQTQDDLLPGGPFLTEDGKFRSLGSLLDFESIIEVICEVKQNSLYDLLVFLSVDMENFRQPRKQGDLLLLEPFVRYRQRVAVNDVNFWASEATGDGTPYVFTMTNGTGLPGDVKFFPVGTLFFVQSIAVDGSLSDAQYKVTAVASAGAESITVSAELYQDNTTLLNTPSRAPLYPNEGFTTYNPAVGGAGGLVYIGVPLVSAYEKLCNEQASLIDLVDREVWIASTRTTHKWCENTQKFVDLVRANNPLANKYLNYITDKEQMAQEQARFRTNLLNQLFWGEPLPGQNTNDWQKTPGVGGGLETITEFVSPALAAEYRLPGGSCRGYRANVIGIKRTLKLCGAYLDNQGTALDISKFEALNYELSRIRTRTVKGDVMPAIDWLTDALTADLLSDYLLVRRNTQIGGNLLRITASADGGGIEQSGDAGWGFYRRTFRLRRGVQIHLLSHPFFDDRVANFAGALNGTDNAGKMLLAMDWNALKMGMFGVRRRQAIKTASAEQAAVYFPDYQCVEQIPAESTSMMAASFGLLNECARSSFLYENFNGFQE